MFPPNARESLVGGQGGGGVVINYWVILVVGVELNSSGCDRGNEGGYYYRQGLISKLLAIECLSKLTATEMEPLQAVFLSRFVQSKEMLIQG